MNSILRRYYEMFQKRGTGPTCANMFGDFVHYTGIFCAAKCGFMAFAKFREKRRFRRLF